jgi:hypothetical protein
MCKIIEEEEEDEDEVTVDVKRVVQPAVVSEHNEDVHERRLREFVLAMEKKKAAATGSAAREVRDAQIVSLVEQSDMVRILPSYSFNRSRSKS